MWYIIVAAFLVFIIPMFTNIDNPHLGYFIMLMAFAFVIGDLVKKLAAIESSSREMALKLDELVENAEKIAMRTESASHRTRSQAEITDLG